MSGILTYRARRFDALHELLTGANGARQTREGRRQAPAPSSKLSGAWRKWRHWLLYP